LATNLVTVWEEAVLKPTDRVWNGPFDKGRVTNFLMPMREGATAHLYGDASTLEPPDRVHLGWLRKEAGACFAADIPNVGMWVKHQDEYDPVEFDKAVSAVVELDPGYIVHNSQWAPGEPAPTLVEEVTPDLREWVRNLTQDSASGGDPVLRRRKEEYGKGLLNSQALASSVLSSLGFNTATSEVYEDLVPVVEDAFRVFQAQGPNLDPS
jgi:hypothetical protein